jgi:hypothetical protein
MPVSSVTSNPVLLEQRGCTFVSVSNRPSTRPLEALKLPIQFIADF